MISARPRQWYDCAMMPPVKAMQMLPGSREGSAHGTIIGMAIIAKVAILAKIAKNEKYPPSVSLRLKKQNEAGGCGNYC